MPPRGILRRVGKCAEGSGSLGRVGDERQPGQLLFAGFEGTVAPSDLLDAIGRGEVGGVILFARKFGGEEASRVVTAAWGLAALAVLAELSYLAPALGEADLPAVRFTIAFVAAAMAAQYMAANIYDVTRGGGRWWRAPLYAGLAAALSYGAVYFPGVYAGTGAPWLSWMIGDIAIKTLCAVGFLGVYGVMRRRLRPGRGYGGR